MMRLSLLLFLLISSPLLAQTLSLGPESSKDEWRTGVKRLGKDVFNFTLDGVLYKVLEVWGHGGGSKAILVSSPDFPSSVLLKIHSRRFDPEDEFDFMAKIYDFNKEAKYQKMLSSWGLPHRTHLKISQEYAILEPIYGFTLEALLEQTPDFSWVRAYADLKNFSRVALAQQVTFNDLTEVNMIFDKEKGRLVMADPGTPIYLSENPKLFYKRLSALGDHAMTLGECLQLREYFDLVDQMMISSTAERLSFEAVIPYLEQVYRAPGNNMAERLGHALARPSPLFTCAYRLSKFLPGNDA